MEPAWLEEPTTGRELIAEGFAKGFARAYAKAYARVRPQDPPVSEECGLAEALICCLEGRGLPPSDAESARIRGCGDVATLRGWIVRAANAASVDDVLD
jgi:hypothetical protein